MNLSLAEGGSGSATTVACCTCAEVESVRTTNPRAAIKARGSWERTRDNAGADERAAERRKVGNI